MGLQAQPNKKTPTGAWAALGPKVVLEEALLINPVMLMTRLLGLTMVRPVVVAQEDLATLGVTVLLIRPRLTKQRDL